MSKSVFIISGEESGDLHGASLIVALKKLVPDLTVTGMGGERMRRAGLVGLDSKEVSVVGITEVIEKSPKIIKAFKELKRLVSHERFDAVILIDFPDFNLRFAREVKRLKLPLIYYISPQVWAWRKDRVRKIAALVDKMLVVFPFEVELYRNEGVDVEYVGHPLVDAAVCGLTKEEARGKIGLPASGTVISLLPGSRTAEIKRLLPPMLKASEIIQRGIKSGVRFILPAAASVEDSLITELLKGSLAEIKVLRNETYAALRASDAAVVASGTATLETALIGAPMVIVYKMSPLTYGIAKMLVGVKHVGLPNIVAGRKIVEELIQDRATPENIADEVLSILKDFKKKDDIILGYNEVKERLGAGGAADRAASRILKMIG